MHIYAYASDNAYLLRSTRVFVSTHQVSINTIVLARVLCILCIWVCIL